MSINSHDQPERAQKFSIAQQDQSQDKINQIEQRTKAKKAKDKARKGKKRRQHQRRQKKQDNSPIATKSNMTQASTPESHKKSDVISRDLKKTFLKLSVIILIRRVTISRIILSQKTIYSLGNFYISDCQFGGLGASTLYLISGLISKNRPGKQDQDLNRLQQ